MARCIFEDQLVAILEGSHVTLLVQQNIKLVSCSLFMQLQVLMLLPKAKIS
jgi:hypothetical protein